MRLTSRDPVSTTAQQQQQRPASSGLREAREAGTTTFPMPSLSANSAGSAGSRPPLHPSDRENRTGGPLPPAAAAAAASPAVSGRTRSSASNGGGGGGGGDDANTVGGVDSHRSVAFAAALNAVGGASAAMMNAPGFAATASGSGLAARRGKRKQPDPGRRDGSAVPANAAAPPSSGPANRRRPRSASPAPGAKGTCSAIVSGLASPFARASCALWGRPSFSNLIT